MQRICFVLQVRPERLEEYKERHKNVWPDMLAALRETGWNNYSLFLRPDGLLVGYLETDDFARSLREMSKRPINELWQRDMSPFFSAPAGATQDLAPDASITPLEEIFHLGSPTE
jgi:L-rhamnose mutarotase